jgi:anti-anti-sigma factor
MRDAALRFDTRPHESAVVVTARGTLDGGTSPALRGVLHKCLVEQPDAVILDLTGVTVADRTALSVLCAVARQASLWPAVPFAVVESRADVVGELRGWGIPRELAVRPTLAAALEAIDHDGARPTVREVLPPISGAAKHARAVTTDACLRWRCAELVGRACAVVTELISNASRHAGTVMTLRVSRRGRWLLVAVEDGGAALPEPRPMPDPAERAGRGLAIVAALSHRWGCLPTESGKVVWAALRV